MEITRIWKLVFKFNKPVFDAFKSHFNIIVSNKSLLSPVKKNTLSQFKYFDQLSKSKITTEVYKNALLKTPFSAQESQEFNFLQSRNRSTGFQDKLKYMLSWNVLALQSEDLTNPLMNHSPISFTLVGLGLFLTLHAFFDVWYFFRFLNTVIAGRYFKRKTNFLNPTTVYGICITTDIDIFLTHMNNARQVRELDFARFDFLTQIRFFDYMRQIPGATILVGSVSIRYRLPLMLFTRYKIVSVPIWWDSKNLYMEQRIVTLSDGIPRSVAFVKLASIKLDFEEFMGKNYPELEKPHLPDELLKWIQSNEISSARMKKQNLKT